MSEEKDKIARLVEEIRRDRETPPAILIIDDDTVHCELMKELLRGSQYSVETAYSGEEGLERIASGYSPSLVILDLRLTGMDGLEVFREIKKKFPDVEVSFLTGAQDDERLSKISAIGWAKIIPKPNSLEQFEALKGALLNA